MHTLHETYCTLNILEVSTQIMYNNEQEQALSDNIQFNISTILIMNINLD